MAPRPGDPHAPLLPSEGGADEDEGEGGKWDSIEQSSILNFNIDAYDSNLESALAEAKHWKDVADELHGVGFPLFLSAKGTSTFPERIQCRARQLNAYLERAFTFPGAAPPAEGLQPVDVCRRLRVLACQGLKIDAFRQLMTSLDFSQKCNAIWENDAIAYRCSTCALTPCMSLCQECFKGGNHEGHDVVRFFSREGGACDCGNEDVLKASGFCKRHDAKAARPPSTPPHIVSLCEFIVVKLFVRLFSSFRGWSEKYIDERLEQNAGGGVVMYKFCGRMVEKADEYIKFIQELIDYGGPIRDAVARILNNEELYSSVEAQMKMSSSLLNVDVRTLYKKEILQQWANSEKRDITVEKISVRSLLHELLFWIVRLVFPQPLINISLSLLSDISYRDEFARRFFLLYPFTADVMLSLCDGNLSNELVMQTISRTIHISVQMLSSSALCSQLNHEIGLIRILVKTIETLLGQTMQSSRLLMTTYFNASEIERGLPAGRMRMIAQFRDDDVNRLEDAMEIVIDDEDADPEERGHRILIGWVRNEENPGLAERACQVETSSWNVIDPDKSRLIQMHGYWFTIGDLQNLLSHADCVVQMCTDDEALRSYVDVIGSIHGMNVFDRIVVGDHRMQDSIDEFQRFLIKLSYNEAFTLEYDMAANSMFNMVLSLVATKESLAARRLFTFVTDKLEDWFISLRVADDKPWSVPKGTVSFHLPLTRHLSTLITHLSPVMDGIREDVRQLIKRESFMRKLMLYPVRLQAAKAEWIAGMWARNGQQMRVQCLLYAQTHTAFAYQMPDVDLVRFCAANASLDWTLAFLCDAFSLDDVFNSPEGRFDGGKREPIDGDEEGEGEEMEKRFGQVFWQARRSRQLTRLEWIDPMLFGFLKLISELVVLRTNSGATDRESLRDEMVTTLAQEDSTHSRLRQSMPEKGSRGAELIDSVFASLLNEVAEFHEADRGDALQQGEYSLRPDALSSFFCPVFATYRAYTPRHVSSVLLRVEKLDRKAANRLDSHVDVWTPYRLVSFHDELRHPWMRDIPRLLVHPRFLLLAANALRQYVSDATASPPLAHDAVMLKESTLQLLIYLLSLSLVFIRDNFDEVEQAELMDNWLSPLDQMGRQEGDRTTTPVTTPEGEPWSHSLAATIVDLVPLLFVAPVSRASLSAPVADSTGSESEKRRGAKVREAMLAEPKQRIQAGSGADYLGRLLALLYRAHANSRKWLDQRFPAAAAENEKAARADEAATEREKAAAARKERAARLQQNILAQKKKAQSQTMKKLMESEKMTQEDVDQLDTTQKQVRLYECPICGDETPSTLENPMGLFSFIQANAASHNAQSLDASEMTLMELDAASSSNTRRQQSPMKGPSSEGDGSSSSMAPVEYRDTRLLSWVKARDDVTSMVTLGRDNQNSIASQMSYDNADMLFSQSINELKTCGHAAHLSCMKQYREAVLSNRVARQRHVDLHCPLCRCITNSLLPIAIDSGFETQPPPSDHSMTAAQKLMIECVQNAVQITTVGPNAKAYQKHYIDSMEDFVNFKQQDDHRNNRAQSVLLGLFKSNIEKNLLLDRLGFLEKKQLRTCTLVSEHLAPAAATRATENETKVVLALLDDLLVEDDADVSQLKTGCDERLSDAADAMDFIDADEAEKASGSRSRIASGEADLMESSDLAESSTSSLASPSLNSPVTGAELELAVVRARSEEPGASGSRVEGTGSTSESVKMRQRLPQKRRRNSAVRAEISAAESSNNQWQQALADFDPALVELLGRPQKQSTPEATELVEVHETMVPLLFYDSPLLLLRLSSYAILNHRLNAESRLQVLRVLLRRVAAASAVRTHLRLVARTSVETILSWQNRHSSMAPSTFFGLRFPIAKIYASSPFFHKMHVSDNDFSSYERDLDAAMEELIRFTAQFWHETKVLSLPEGFRTAAAGTREQIFAHVFGDSSIALPSDKLLARWIRPAIPILSWLRQLRKGHWNVEPIAWKPFTLPRLPDAYDDLFSRYFGRQCVACCKVPTMPFVCLICGEMVCLDRCCVMHDTVEVERHASDCNVHLAPFLALNSALVVLVKEKLASIWGSVYLDAHGEEDRNLRRGKPLRLSQKRWDALLRDWVQGDFSRSLIPFTTISSLPVTLKEAHYRT